MEHKKAKWSGDASGLNEKTLSLLFDYQRFEHEPELEALLDEAENEYAPLLDELLDAACTQLDKAKGMHDELERVYRPYMDFSALTEYTEGVISSLFD